QLRTLSVSNRLPNKERGTINLYAYGFVLPDLGERG
ncbi:unnamed protein product, partial [marine sediment metagenome]